MLKEVQDFLLLLPQWCVMLVIVAVHCFITFCLKVPGCPTYVRIIQWITFIFLQKYQTNYFYLLVVTLVLVVFTMTRNILIVWVEQRVTSTEWYSKNLICIIQPRFINLDLMILKEFWVYYKFFFLKQSIISMLFFLIQLLITTRLFFFPLSLTSFNYL